MKFKISFFLLSCLIISSCSTDQVETTPKNIDDENVTSEKEAGKPLLVVKSVDKEKGLPKETQMAQCTVTSGDIKASAQATFSKKLEGFCSTQDMVDLRENLASLEDRLYYELHNLKLMIQNLMPSNNHHQPRQDYQKNYYNSHQDFRQDQDHNFQTQPNYHRPIPPPPTINRENNVKQNALETSTVKSYRNFTSSARPITTSTTEEISIKTPELLTLRKNNLKSLETNKRRPIITTQEPETTYKPPVTEPTKSEYTYYWKLENFPKVFTHAKKNEVYSHIFNVKGLFLRIRAKQDLENTLIDIEHLANVENSEKLEVEISDGFVFKEIAEEKLFQYSFAVMDLNRPLHDLISPIYWNTDTDNFLMPNSLHLLANYVKNDSLLIKLIIKF